MSNLLTDMTALLARREHGAHELMEKLSAKGYLTDDIVVALEKYQQLGLQSDLRFASSRYRHRVQQGYGPIRIRQELQHLRLDKDLIDAVFEGAETDWVAQARGVLIKKYQHITTPLMQKQKKFLLYRGFSMTIAIEALREFYS